MCALTQGTGAAASVTNAGQASVSAATFIGWAFSNTTDGTVSSPDSADQYLALAGGEGAGSEDGTWDWSYLALLSGTYDFTGASSLNVGTFYVGNADPGDDPLASLLGDSAAAPDVTVGPTSSYFSQSNGTLSLGSSTDPSNLDLNVTGGTTTLTSPDSDPSTLGCVNVTDGATLNLYGATTVTGCDGLTLGTPYTDSQGTLNNNGTLTLLNDYLAIEQGGVANQNGTLILDGAEASHTWLGGAGGGSVGGVLDGTGTTIVQEPDDIGPYVFGCWAAFENVEISQQTIDNESSDCGLELEDTITLKDVTFDNDGYLVAPWPAAALDLQGNGGTVLNNSGTMDINAALFSAIPGATTPKIDNTGSIIDDNPGQTAADESTIPEYVPTEGSRIQWALTGDGTTSPPADNIDPTGSSWYGGSNPAAPYQDTPRCGDPVVCATGDQTETQTDLSFGGLGGLSLTRTYNSQLAASQTTPGMFGYGWTSSFEAHLWVDGSDGVAAVQQPNGSMAGFTITDGSFIPDSGVEASLTENEDGTYSYRLPDQATMTFDSSGNLVSQTSSTGLTTSLGYNDNGQLTSVTAPSGRQITFTYNTDGLVATATDPTGLVISYGYDDSDDLTSVTPSAGPDTTGWQFGYDNLHELTSMTDPDGNTTTIAYSAGQVVSQTDQLDHTETWSYAPGETLVTSPAGNVTDYLFNDQDQPVSATRGYGTSAATATTTTYNDAGEPTAVTSGGGNTTTYAYDDAGNRTSETNQDGHTTTWTYDTARNVTSETLPSGLEMTVQL